MIGTNTEVQLEYARKRAGQKFIFKSMKEHSHMYGKEAMNFLKAKELKCKDRHR